MGRKENMLGPGDPARSAKPLPATLSSSESETGEREVGRWVSSTPECYNLLLYFLILFFKIKKTERARAQVLKVDS